MPGHTHNRCPLCQGCTICYPHVHKMDAVSDYPPEFVFDFNPRPHWERTIEYQARARVAFGKA